MAEAMVQAPKVGRLWCFGTWALGLQLSEGLEFLSPCPVNWDWAMEDPLILTVFDYGK